MSKRHKPMPTQTFPATITGFSHDGRGIASINGKVTFLRGGLAGEEVEFLYKKKHRQFDVGRPDQRLSAQGKAWRKIRRSQI